MKVEIISRGSIFEAQEEINKFLEASTVKLISIETKANAMHDLYYDGNVCNQWIEYITVIIYN